MTVLTTSRATAAAVGYDADQATNTGLLRARATASGYAAFVHGAAPVTGAAPDALRLEILTDAGAQLANDHVARRNLSFVVEHNGSGSVSFETDLDALTDGIDSALLDPSNLVRVHYGDMASAPYGVAEGFLTSAAPVKDDAGRWSLPLQCPGSWDVLDFGVLWPPAGVVSDTREFSYTAGMTGPAWVPEEWSKPIGKLVKESFRWLKRRPTGWPERKSYWLGSTSPEKVSPLGKRQFVGSFTLTARKDVRFYTAGDDTLKLYLNGGKLKFKGRDAWHRTATFVRTLPAGTYTMAAEVANVAGENGKSGFIFAAAQLKNNGDRDHWLLRSAPDTFQVKIGDGLLGQVPLPPDGWYPAAVLHTHVSEAAARGVDFHPSMTLTFTTTADSNGTAWTTKGPAEYDIGISGAELGEKIRALGYDVAMLPGLRLAAWANRGFDLRDRVIISAPLRAGWTSRAWPRVRSVGLTHHESGWTETAGAAEVLADYGRREMTISGGGVDGDLQAHAFARAAMTTAGSPEETIEVEITSADLRAGAPQPFRDFNVADIITVETIGGFQAMKVMTIGGAEQETKEVRFTIAGYPV